MKRPNILRQNLGLLVAFDALITEGNATKAAERLSLGQPAVSHLLGRLREIFSDRLFDRTRDGLVPTRRARELHAKLVPHLKGLEALFVQDNSFDPISTERVFRLVVSDMVQVYFIPGLLRAAESAAPGISFVTVPIDSNLVTEHIERDEVDLAINHCPDPAPWIRTCPLFEVEYMCWYNPACGEAPSTIDRFMARPQVSVTYRGPRPVPLLTPCTSRGSRAR
ncbi:MAG: LysR family transcriptional regulator [Devosia sp.]|nr:LysR family transcriptional regulator [Devosia sp.]